MRAVRSLTGLLALACIWTGCAGAPDTAAAPKAETSPSLKALQWDRAPGPKRYEFLWSDPRSEYLTRLRDTYRLESLLDHCTSDVERVSVIGHWVHGLWEHNGSNQPAQGDPIFIIEEAKRGQRFRCVEYAIVITGCLKALGIPARTLGLKTEDVETRPSGAGHVVAEAYLEDEGRWIMVDGQFDVMPVLAGRALSAVELQQALAQKSVDLSARSLSQVDGTSYFQWVGEYLFYFDSQLDQRDPGVTLAPEALMLVPLGAREPHVFQKKYPIANMSYTNSLADFYPIPEYK